VLSLSIKTEVAIIVPKKDLAAQTMWKQLNEQSLFNETAVIFDNNPVYSYEKLPDKIILVHSDRDGVESNHLDLYIEAKLYIFASRHRAASGTPALLIHPTGNWSKITLAGREKELSYTSSRVLKNGFMKLQEKKEKYNLEDFKVDMEVTHHGPTELETPLVFMELGSNEEFWLHEKGGRAVGEAIVETAEEFVNQTQYSGESYIGFGGNHYAYRFHKHIMENSAISISHIAPKHSLDEITLEMVKEAFDKTIENPVGALIDKKGARSEQRRIISEFVEELGKECIQI